MFSGQIAFDKAALQGMSVFFIIIDFNHYEWAHLGWLSRILLMSMCIGFGKYGWIGDAKTFI